MYKQIYQQFLVVIASARAKGQGDRAQGTGPNARLQLPLGIVGIFVLLSHYFLTYYLSFYCLLLPLFYYCHVPFVVSLFYFFLFSFSLFFCLIHLAANPSPHANFHKKTHRNRGPTAPGVLKSK